MADAEPRRRQTRSPLIVDGICASLHHSGGSVAGGVVEERTTCLHVLWAERPTVLVVSYTP